MNIIIRAVIFVFFYISIFANNVNDFEKIIVSGYGGSEKEAVNDALVSAVESVTGTLVSSEVFIKNMKVIDEKIKTQSAGFISSYKVLSVKQKKGVFQAAVEADVKKELLHASLKTLNIAVLDINDPVQVSKNVTADRYNHENKNKYIDKFFSSFKGSDFIITDVKDIIYDKTVYDGGYVPYSVMFEISINTEMYNKKVSSFEKDISAMGVIAEKKSAGVIGSEKKQIRLENGDFAGLEIFDNARTRNRNNLYIASRYGQRFEMNEYHVDKTIHSKLISNLTNSKNKMIINAKIMLKNSTGSAVISNNFLLNKPEKEQLAIYFTKKDGKKTAVWADSDNGIKDIVIFKNEGSPYLSPFFSVIIGGNEYIVQKIEMGYHGFINENDISKVKQITLELK